MYESSSAQSLRNLLHGKQIHDMAEVQSKRLESTEMRESMESLLSFDRLGSSMDELNVFETTHNVKSGFKGSNQDFQVLLRQQDEYIEQLEQENNILKNEMKGIRSSVREVTEENERIVQKWKTYLLNHLTSTNDRKGLSDEEKMFYGTNDINDVNNYDFKIKQLEEQLELIKNQNTCSECRKRIRNDDQGHFVTVNLLKTERDDLLEINNQLQTAVNKMKYREDEAETQVRNGIQLVEAAHLEKSQAIAEREQIRKDLAEETKRNAELRRVYEQRIVDERNKALAVYEKKLKDSETELVEINETLTKVQVEYERALREKREVHTQLQQARLHVDSTNEELQNLVAHLREEETKFLIERNGTAHEIAHLKATLERTKQEHHQEVLLLKSNLDDARNTVKRMERDYLDAKAEVASIAEKARFLERQASSRDHERGTTNRDFINEDRLGKEFLQESLRDVELQNSRKYVEMERFIEQQMVLLGEFRNECKQLTDKVDKLTDRYKNSTDRIKQENFVLLQKLSASGEQCKQLETVYNEQSHRHRDLRTKLQVMKDETSKQNEQILDLLSRQTLLLKERQFLRDEVEFLCNTLKMNEK